MHRRLWTVFVLTLVCGCDAGPAGPAPGPPPVEFSFRDSQIPTRGMVAGIQNTSTDETLEGLIVQVQSAGEEGTRSHRVDAPLRPQDTITVGWMELDGWTLKPGDQMTVRCDQYAGEASATVPEE